MDSTGHLLYDFDAHRSIAGEGTDGDRLLRVNKAILQLTTHALQGSVAP